MRFTAVAAAVATTFTASVASAAADFVYVPSEWPAIYGDVKTGQGAPTAKGNATLTKMVGWTPRVNLPTNTTGVCPTDTSALGSNGACWWTCANGPDGFPCAAPEDRRVCQPGKWGITYDDGPTQNTDAFLDLLKSKAQKATFCLIGSQVIRFPEQAKRIHAEGHDLCVHTWSHPSLTTLTDDEIIAELKYTELAIQAVTGVRPKYWRPPKGDLDNRVRAIAQKMGYETLLWMYDTNDFKMIPMNPPVPMTLTYSSLSDILQTQINNKNFPNGVLSLSHTERFSGNVEWAKTFFDMTSAAKIPLLPASQCFNDPKPYLEDKSASSSSSANTASGSPTASPVLLRPFALVAASLVAAVTLF